MHRPSNSNTTHCLFNPTCTNEHGTIGFQRYPSPTSLDLEFENFDMSFKVLFICLLLVVSAQQDLFRVPDGCRVPKSPPTCVYSTVTPFFKSCGIYDGGNCPLFCHALQAQYWTGKRFSRRCFRFSPSLIALKRLYAFCMYRCAYAKRRIRQYRINGLKKIGSDATPVGWKTSNIKALIYLSVNRYGFVKSRDLVYTSNPTLRGNKRNNRTPPCPPKRPYNRCTCSACSRYRASCPSCCRSKGYLWA